MSDRVVAARSVDEAARLRAAWERLAPADVNADPDVFLSMLETLEDAVRPHVLLAESNGTPKAMLVARLDHAQVPVRLGYRQLYAPRLRALTVVQGGLLGADTGEPVGVLFEEVQAALARGEADVLRLRRVRVDSELHRLARERPRWTTRGRAGQRSLRWRLQLPESLDAILQTQSTRTRGNHRRYARRLEEELGDRLAFDVYREPGDLEQVIRASEAVSVKTYQHRLGAGFAADPSELRLLDLGAKRGWLRAFVLSVDGEPCAFWLGLVYGGVFFTGPTGYDPALGHLRLGTYVLMKMLEYLCGDDDVDEVDYGIGDAEYKRHFGTESWLEEDVLVFAPSFRGVRVNLTRTVILSTAAAAQRGPGLQGVKRRWRARLAARARKKTDA